MPGSPPLVRERLELVAGVSTLPGITPARAGKTLPILPRILHVQDHPRSCGKDR